MKQVRSFCATFVLLLMLSFSAFAGDVHGPCAPDPSPGSEIQDPTVKPTGDETSLNAISPSTTLDAITDLTVRLSVEWLLAF